MAQAALYYPDAASKQREIIAQSGEPSRPLTDWALSYSRSTPLSHPEAWALQEKRDIYRDEYQALLKRRGVDFILSPTYPAAAAVMGESQYWNYTSIWNLVDLPSAVFPSGITVDPKIDVLTEQDKKYVPRDEVDEREWRKYEDPGRYEGASVGLQIAGRRFKDEGTLTAAKVVEEIVREKKHLKG